MRIHRGGCVPGVEGLNSANAHSAPPCVPSSARLASRRGANPAPSALPQPTLSPKPPIHLFRRSTYCGKAELWTQPEAFLSFHPPSSSSSCWQPSGALALASGSSSRPGCGSLGLTGARPRLLQRWSRRSTRGSSRERCCGSRCAASPARAGGDRQRASARAALATLCTRPAPAPPQVRPAEERCDPTCREGLACGRGCEAATRVEEKKAARLEAKSSFHRVSVTGQRQEK